MALPIAALIGLVSPGGGSARRRPRPATEAPAEPAFLFDLATSTGASESTWAAVAYDRKHDELFTIHGGLVHIFNQAGMETFTFGGDGDLGIVERVAVLESGEMLLLANLGGRRAILRCDYRGELLGPFEPKPLPEAFAEVRPGPDPGRRGARSTWSSPASMRVVVTDGEGKVEQTHDLAALVRQAGSRASRPG